MTTSRPGAPRAPRAQPPRGRVRSTPGRRCAGEQQRLVAEARRLAPERVPRAAASLRRGSRARRSPAEAPRAAGARRATARAASCRCRRRRCCRRPRPGPATARRGASRRDRRPPQRGNRRRTRARAARARPRASSSRTSAARGNSRPRVRARRPVPTSSGSAWRRRCGEAGEPRRLHHVDDRLVGRGRIGVDHHDRVLGPAAAARIASPNAATPVKDTGLRSIMYCPAALTGC